MAVRSKTKKRLVILMVGTFILSGGVVGVYAVRMKHIEQETQRHLEEGMAHFKAGKYLDAMHHLGNYVNKHPNDWEVLYDYTQARLKVEEPNFRHIIHGLNLLARVIDLNPDHPTARHELLDLYIKTGRTTEAEQTADTILASDPNDDASLYAKALTRVRLKEYEDALPITNRYIEVKPNALDGRLLWLHIVTSLGRPADEIRDTIAELYDQHPEDPRFELLMSKAHQYMRNGEDAIKTALIAATREPPDETFVRQLVFQLEALNQFETAMEVLEKHGRESKDRKLRTTLANHWWQQNRIDDMLSLLEHIEGGTQYGDPELLGLRSLALIRKERSAEVQPIIDALRNRKNSDTAAAWAIVLDQGITQGDTGVGVAIKIFRAALERRPSYPIFQFLLGRAYLAAGETQLGLHEMALITKALPSWQEPLLILIRTLMKDRRFVDAHKLGDLGAIRWPRSLRMQTYRAQAWAAHVNAEGLPTEDLARFVAKIQKVSPGEQRTLPIHAALLASAGKKAEAEQVVEAALDADTPLAGSTLLQLIQMAQNQDLRVAQRCVERYHQEIGQTSDLALADAMRLAAKGLPEEGLKLLDDGLSAADKNQKGSWQIGRARFLERIGDELASAAWIELAEALPANRKIQQMALRATSTWTDRQFIDETIKRHQQLNAERSPIWRVARAKWWLSGPDPTRHADDAAALLLDAIKVDQSKAEPYLLLANALELRGNIDGAAKQLEAALQLAPQSGMLAVELARLHQALGQRERANRAIEDALEIGSLTPEQLRRAAAIYTQQGNAEKAVELLLLSYGDDPAPPDRLLAILFRRLDLPDRVEAIVASLLKDPTALDIEFIANYYGSLGRLGQASAVLARLDELDLTMGKRALIIARHRTRNGTTVEAIQAYRDAVAADPKESSAHLGLAQMLLRADRVAEAVEAVEAGTAALPNNPALNFVHANRTLLALVAREPQAGAKRSHRELRNLAESLVADEAHREAAVDAINTLKEFTFPADDASAVAVALNRLSDAYPRFLTLQNLIVRHYFMAGLPDSAIAVASRTMSTFPNAVEPASLAAAAMAQRGRWAEALAMTRQWQKRATGDTLQADVVATQALIQMGDPDQAVRQLDPYIERAMQNPDDYSIVIVPHIQALIAADRADEANAMFAPLLTQSNRWRLTWTWLAVFGGTDEATGAAWLDQVGHVIPEDGLVEQVVLAQGWQGLSERTGNIAHTDTARGILEELVERDDAPVEAHFVLAMLNDASGDVDEAAAGYRRVIELDAERAIAKNNLAMILIHQNGGLSEAIQLGAEAVKADPSNPNFRDTLAFALAKNGNLARAVTELEAAIDVAPDNPIWQINLAWILVEKGQNEDARELIETVTSIGLNADSLPDPVRARYDQLQSKLSVSATPASG